MKSTWIVSRKEFLMQIDESLFDIGYLAIAIALGIRLLLLNSKEAKLFGIMAILLGLGDSFHLPESSISLKPRRILCK